MLPAPIIFSTYMTLLMYIRFRRWYNCAASWCLYAHAHRVTSQSVILIAHTCRHTSTWRRLVATHVTFSMLCHTYMYALSLISYLIK